MKTLNLGYNIHTFCGLFKKSKETVDIIKNNGKSDIGLRLRL